MSKRVIETEDGERVLLPGKKKCACGRPATRYCDFPKYQKPHQYLYQQEHGCDQVLCAKPLCDQCAIEQPNGKDFCYEHNSVLDKLLSSVYDEDEE